MNDKEKLKQCFEDVIWMAIRYAHGRNTYAPDMVRRAIRDFKEVFPEWEIRQDKTVQPPEKSRIHGLELRGDYLDDLFN